MEVFGDGLCLIGSIFMATNIVFSAKARDASPYDEGSQGQACCNTRGACP